MFENSMLTIRILGANPTALPIDINVVVIK